jgi:ACS family tartrate transporter-like MFS transporter
MGFVTLWYLTDRPEQADWLTEEERTWLADRMKREEDYRQQHHGSDLFRTMADGRVWLLCLVYITIAAGSNSYGLYGPKVLKDTFPDLKETGIGLLVALPGLAAVVAMVVVGMHSDRTGERRWHVAVPGFVAAAGWLLVIAAPSPIVVLLGLMMAQAAMLSMLAPFWALPTSFLSGAAAAGGIAFINSVGNLGGTVSILIGEVKESTGSYDLGFAFLAVALVAGGVLALRARHDGTFDRVLEKS